MEDNNSTGTNWIAGVAPPSELLTRSMNQIYEMECREQPARLASLLSAYQADPIIERELDKLRTLSLSTGPILFIGMGASYCSSITGSSYLQSCGRSSFTVDAGEWLHYSVAWKSRCPVFAGDHFRRKRGVGSTLPKGSGPTDCLALQQ